MLTANIHGPRITSSAPCVKCVLQPTLKGVGGFRLGLVTTGAVVPIGNPDRLEVGNSTRWGSYSIEGLARLSPQEFQSIHRGFDTTWANDDPNRILPLDGLRILQQKERIRSIHSRYYVTSGQGTYVKDAVRMAGEIADELHEAGVEGILLVSN